MTSIVEVADVHRSFQRGRERLDVLRGADLRIDEGDIVVLHGRSGAGKTTLLNIVGGLDRPDSGSVRIGSDTLDSLSDAQLGELRRTSVAFIFQGLGLLPVLTAAENVEVPLRLAGVKHDERQQRSLEMLEAVGLRGRANHLPGELSGGEQQRVAIARAIVGKPMLLIADEPTGQLDAATGRQVMKLLHGLAERDDLALLIASHDPAILGGPVRRYELRQGRLHPSNSLAEHG